MKLNKSQSDVERSIMQIAMLDMGIIPIENTSFDMKRVLGEINDPAESRMMRRKFRKTWRKISAMQVAKGDVSAKSAKATLGLGKRVPSKTERNARKKMVYDAVWKTVVVPMIDRLNSPTDDVIDPSAKDQKTRQSRVR